MNKIEPLVEKDYIDYAIDYSYKPTLKNLINKEDE